MATAFHHQNNRSMIRILSLPQRNAGGKALGYCSRVFTNLDVVMTESLAAEKPDAIAFDEELADGTLTVIDRTGVAHRLPGVDGMSLMEIVRGFDLPIPATCGGAAACGTCHVFADARYGARLPKPTEEENWQLDHLIAARSESRLACQIIWNKGLLDGLVVTLAPLEQ
ncbi:MAG: hypothetical protein FD175_57 [Beijerinckiaceae bacterium]|nr:MAG: hypothetical protein FD175_57 [Beijerinckiaceae bacterium]